MCLISFPSGDTFLAVVQSPFTVKNPKARQKATKNTNAFGFTSTSFPEENS
jgi:hypothetical protein